MDPYAQRLLVAVIRRGSFAAVARDLEVAPSSVSRTIANLERELGVRLLQRTTRRLSPTPVGLRYAERVVPLLDELDAASAEARDATTEPRGRVRMTAPVSFAQLNLIPLLPALREHYPALEVDLLLSDTRVDLLAAGMDLALRLGRLEDGDVIRHHLCAIDYVLCASPSYIDAHGAPTEPVNVAEHPCLTFPLPAGGALLGAPPSWHFRRGDEPVIEVGVGGPVSISNAIALRECAVAGMGLLVSARWVIGRELARGELVPLLPEYEVTFTDFGASASLLLPSARYVPRKVRALIDFLGPRFAEGPPSSQKARLPAS